MSFMVVISVLLFLSISSRATYGYKLPNGNNQPDSLNSKMGKGMREYKKADKLQDLEEPMTEEEFFSILSREAEREEEDNHGDAPVLPEALLAGVGYNLIFGAPEGTFETGGVDPGLLVNRPMFRFTYDEDQYITNEFGEGYHVPDQVNYYPFDSCSANNEERVYSGEKSYQTELSASIEASAGYGPVSFSASASFAQMKRSTEGVKRVMLDKKKICQYASLRLVEVESEESLLSSEFMRELGKLPTEYDQEAYFNFISDWGTHVVFEAKLGTKTIERFSSTYKETFDYLKTQAGGSAGLSVGIGGFSGSIEVSVEYLDESAQAETEFGSSLKTFDIGSQNRPLPIHLTLEPIYILLDVEYLKGAYESLQIEGKRGNLERAYDEYKVNGRELGDPHITVPLTWPEETYGFPKMTAEEECPGDDFNSGTLTEQRVIFTSNTSYCVKKYNTDIGGEWPQGRYCINQKGECPTGFDAGAIVKWRDLQFVEAFPSKYTATGYLPIYDATAVFIIWTYCCRDDASINTLMYLPVSTPFYLYEHKERGCQQVFGMTAEEMSLVPVHNEMGWPWEETETIYGDTVMPLINPDGSTKLFVCHYTPKNSNEKQSDVARNETGK